MHGHFDKYLNVRQIILSKRPRMLVECGVARGENTRQLLSLLSTYDFKLYSINDCPFAEETMEFKKSSYGKSFDWIYDLSYRAIGSFEDGSVDFFSIDTDHNYWTMERELAALHPKLKLGGVVVIHDMQTYRKNSGKANRYGTGDRYPEEEIDHFASLGFGMGDAVWDFLKSHQEYIVLRQSAESHGAIAIEKVNA